jgi:hypothetical protein
MHRAGADYTRTFRLLSAVDANRPETLAPLADAVAAPALLDPWLERWLARVGEETVPGAHRRAAMAAVNPKYVLRNWIAQEVIEAAEARDTAPLQRVMALLRAPYDEHPGMERYAVGPAEGMIEVLSVVRRS